MLAFSTCLFVALTLILVKMGTTIKREDVDVRHPKLFLHVFVHQYVIYPIFVFSVALLFKPQISQVYGMFVVALTPATAAASVSAYSVDADVPLALALSIMSLLSSVFFTPLGFSLLISMYSKYTDEKKSSINLPYLRMFGLMTYVIFLIASGFKIRETWKTNKRVDVFAKYCQRLSIAFLCLAVAFFLVSKSFLKSMNPKNPYSYFGIIATITYGQLILSYFPICQMEAKKKDAVVLVTMRRSPGIALAIATLSFQNSENFKEVVAFVLVYGMLRDWFCSIPHIMILRKLRLGYYCYKKKKAEAEEAGAVTSESEI